MGFDLGELTQIEADVAFHLRAEAFPHDVAARFVQMAELVGMMLRLLQLSPHDPE